MKKPTDRSTRTPKMCFGRASSILLTDVRFHRRANAKNNSIGAHKGLDIKFAWTVLVSARCSENECEFDLAFANLPAVNECGPLRDSHASGGVRITQGFGQPGEVLTERGNSNTRHLEDVFGKHAATGPFVWPSQLNVAQWARRCVETAMGKVEGTDAPEVQPGWCGEFGRPKITALGQSGRARVPAIRIQWVQMNRMRSPKTLSPLGRFDADGTYRPTPSTFVFFPLPLTALRFVSAIAGLDRAGQPRDSKQRCPAPHSYRLAYLPGVSRGIAQHTEACSPAPLALTAHRSVCAIYALFQTEKAWEWPAQVQSKKTDAQLAGRSQNYPFFRPSERSFCGLVKNLGGTYIVAIFCACKGYIGSTSKRAKRIRGLSFECRKPSKFH